MKNDIIIPVDKIDLKSELVPAIRNLLANGLSESFMRACVRIGDFDKFSGGLKADLVGGLTLNVNAVMKLGGVELDMHEILMNEVNKARSNTFAEVLETISLDGDRRLLLMAQLRKYETLFNLVFGQKTTANSVFLKILDKAFDGLSAVHTSNLQNLGFKTTQNPYFKRIHDKLTSAITADPALTLMLDKSGIILGKYCPPLNNLLDSLNVWLEEVMPAVPKVLIHGDPHLRNIMARGYGKGFAVRFIDPNPDFGFTDRAYDFGKLLHFAEPVGWALAQPSVCHSEWYSVDSKWSLEAESASTKQAEQRRAYLEKEILARITSLNWKDDSTWTARLHISRSSAHFGLLALFSGDDNIEARRFVLAHAVAALADWHAEIK